MTLSLHRWITALFFFFLLVSADIEWFASDLDLLVWKQRFGPNKKYFVVIVIAATTKTSTTTTAPTVIMAFVSTPVSCGEHQFETRQRADLVSRE